MPSYEQEQETKRRRAQHADMEQRRAARVPGEMGRAMHAEIEAAVMAERENALADAERIETETFEMWGGQLGRDLVDAGLSLQSASVQEFIRQGHTPRVAVAEWNKMLADGRERQHYDGLHTQLVALDEKRKTPEIMQAKSRLLKEIEKMELDADAMANSGVEVGGMLVIEIFDE